MFQNKLSNFESISLIIGKKNLLKLCISIFLTICLVGLEILSLAMIMPLMDLILNQNVENKFLFNFMQSFNYQQMYSLENISIIFVIIYFFN